jgi:histidine triad (HIT) family protein
MDCEFCGIVSGEDDGHVVVRRDDAVAFLDIYPAVPGHTLVAPNAHREGLYDLEHEDVCAMFQLVRDVGVAQRRALDADGVSVFQSSGSAAGQDVMHVHAHVIPRFEDDHIRFAPSRSTLSPGEGEDVAEALSQELATR